MAGEGGRHRRRRPAAARGDDGQGDRRGPEPEDGQGDLPTTARRARSPRSTSSLVTLEVEGAGGAVAEKPAHGAPAPAARGEGGGEARGQRQGRRGRGGEGARHPGDPADGAGARPRPRRDRRHGPAGAGDEGRRARGDGGWGGRAAPAAQAKAKLPAPAPLQSGAEDERVPLRGLRKKIAEKMVALEAQRARTSPSSRRST